MEKPWKTRYCLEKPWKTLYSIHPRHVSWQILLYPDMFLGFFRVVLGFVKRCQKYTPRKPALVSVWIFAPARPRSWHTQTPGACGTHVVGCFFWPRERCFHPKKKGFFECQICQRLIFDQKKQQRSTEYVGKTWTSTCWTTKIHQK